MQGCLCRNLGAQWSTTNKDGQVNFPACCKERAGQLQQHALSAAPLEARQHKQYAIGTDAHGEVATSACQRM